MEFVEGDLLSNILKDPLKKEGRPGLNPNISDRALRVAYREMANLVLDLSRPQFPRIGSLGSQSENFAVTKRPLTFNMNEISTFTNLPPSALPKSIFATAKDYFLCLVEQHFAKLRLQRNDAISGEADCNRKHVARCLFRRIIREKTFEYNNGPFRLFCDDFRPSNVLINIQRLSVAAVIDWEFACAAPAEFTYVAPWWLMLQSPEDWDIETDLRGFISRYEPKLSLFLEALRACEDEQIAQGTLSESQRLSVRMEQLMQNGMFWICLAARYSSMFDDICWTFLDERFFGCFTNIEDRMLLLDEDEKTEMSSLYQIKLDQAKDGTLDDNYTVDEMINN
ncbi:hypothetical protein MMC25_003186 [Agyrium rufum]|nr:hypothetical protein [Agyrium rufum]